MGVHNLSIACLESKFTFLGQQTGVRQAGCLELHLSFKAMFQIIVQKGQSSAGMTSGQPQAALAAVALPMIGAVSGHHLPFTAPGEM